MKPPTECPFCSYVVLRHVRAGEVYWFCQHCRQSVPELSCEQVLRPSTAIASEDLSPIL